MSKKRENVGAHVFQLQNEGILVTIPLIFKKLYDDY